MKKNTYQKINHYSYRFMFLLILIFVLLGWLLFAAYIYNWKHFDAIYYSGMTVGVICLLNLVAAIVTKDY
ncbi:hypothetical protein Q4603_05830 [Zobellia galactanivorans]|uniref:hypothetical protein n=1 Tax=Zobellia galactanivorans (strain DSM 12802 / CCUG 47099 / CIP 106680 / NCIMB 13871 / Dsij) TaxID=63186 RepID=UPI0026E3F2B2|nr:hypothetical protein [Zobellia galactanivorans]MDO6808115.1 hypothetical protein [Zobellia galactanivorans]